MAPFFRILPSFGSHDPFGPPPWTGTADGVEDRSNDRSSERLDKAGNSPSGG